MSYSEFFTNPVVTGFLGVMLGIVLGWWAKSADLALN